MTEERMPDRKRLLDTAAEYVLRQRNKSYGEPDEDFQRIARIASAMGFRFDISPGRKEYRELTGSDVALFMIALKTSRLVWAPEHEDSWIDIAGYAACGMETANLEAARSAPVSRETWETAKADGISLAITADQCGEVCASGNHTYRGDCRFRKPGRAYPEMQA